MSIRKFHEIFALEIEAINKRRGKKKRTAIVLEQEDCQRDGTPVMRPKPGSNVIGLALSGGGIRSAAFCLGAMQSLDVRHLIDKLDYLSTVSGGGYIGTSMTAAISAGTTGIFPFTSELRTGEVPGVQHIRDHSNYLFPQGVLNLFGNIAVYLRGIVANVLLLLPYLLVAAGLTVCWVGSAAKLSESSVTFGVTRDAVLLLAAFLAAWGLWRSTSRGRNVTDVGPAAQIFGSLLVAVLIVAFCELQPWVLYQVASGRLSNSFIRGSSGLKVIAGFGTAIGFLGRFLADVLKRTAEKPGFTAFATGILIKLAMYAAGAAVPLLLWAAYLKLSLWGLGAQSPPMWLANLASTIPFRLLYLLAGLVLFFISWFLNANANSLHQLYRDRLSKAFLFDPDHRVTAPPWYSFAQRADAVPETDAASRNSDLKPLDDQRLSDLNADLAPYHLINAALNIEASKYANRRGRNADFFIFSKLFTGSDATGYVDTKQMEDKVTGLTTGTAMAVSGAAASSNMGSSTIKALVPTLAILNVRLGYWLTNPAKVAGTLKKALIWRMFDKLYFLKELLGLLSEDSGTVYLTDGGHLENLGLYELLRRRCKLIIAIDGEADRYHRFMKFPNTLSLDGYAALLAGEGCEVLVAEDTGRYAPHVDLYLNMLNMQLTYDALKIIGFDAALMETMGGEMNFMRELAHAGKIAQGLLVARKKA